MDYGLAKRLKDAGFDQPIGDDANGYYDYDDFYSEDGVYVPTLTELIQACGDITLEIIGNPRSGYEVSCIKTFRFQQVTGKGATLEEAFANLWLALNISRWSAILNTIIFKFAAAASSAISQSRRRLAP